MQQVINISMPAVEIKRLKTVAKKRGHRSVSAYVQRLVKDDQESITVTELLRDVAASRKEYKLGKSIKLNKHL